MSWEAMYKSCGIPDEILDGIFEKEMIQPDQKSSETEEKKNEKPCQTTVETNDEKRKKTRRVSSMSNSNLYFEAQS